MSRSPRRSQDQHPGLAAHLADDRVSAEKRGWVMLALVGHAFLYLLLTATEAIWVIAMAVRVWRRRDVGLVEAARTGVHKPTLSALLAANLGFAVVRRAADRRFTCHRARNGHVPSVYAWPHAMVR